MSTTFVLPPHSEAALPPEHRGVPRDGVKLLVARPQGVEHRTFRDLPELLLPGDLLVVNTSATLPAAVVALHADGTKVPVHVAGSVSDEVWLVELRRPDGPDLTGRPGQELALPGGVVLRLSQPVSGRRVWRAQVTPPTAAVAHLTAHGRPVAYGHQAPRVALADLQNVYATEPGSAEMASAGRPLTAEVLVRLVAGGVAVAPVLLHAGVSSPEAHEPPLPERFAVPAATARLVEHTRRSGGRVVAVGTTVVRALESAISDGQVGEAQGWTDLVLGPERPATVVTGLISGLHTPEASHLLLLEAVAGPRLVAAAYEAAVAGGYLWHEFGDSSLFLP